MTVPSRAVLYSTSSVTQTAGSWSYLSTGIPPYHPRNTFLRHRLYCLCLLLSLLCLVVSARLLFWERVSEVRIPCPEKPPTEPRVQDKVRFPRTKRRLPQCLIVGVRKCGTRALLEFLNVHPQVQKAADEVHFFDDDAKYKLGLEWYRRRMPFSYPDQITVEKTPAYFTTESSPFRIRSMNASIKLVLIVRDPVMRLVSDYAQLAANKLLRDKVLPPFEHVVLLPDGAVDISYKPVRIGLYSLHLRRWLDTFTRQQICVVDGDKMVQDPFLEVRKVEKFLGLPSKINRSSFVFNRTKGFFCVRAEDGDHCLNESKGRKHPIVSSEVLRRLRQFYTPYNREFYAAVGQDFGWDEG